MSTIQPKTYFSATDLRNIREAVAGPSPFKSVATESAQVDDGKKDVFIMAPEGAGLFRSAESANTNVAESLQESGVQVTEKFEDVGVSARVSPEKAEELKELGYQVFDNTPRQMQPGLPKASSNGSQWAMPNVDGPKLLKADKAHNLGFTGKGQTVAVLDSGFDHPAFNDKLTHWKDVVNGSPTPHDGSGHGTHVIGDVLQTAPDANIVAIKVMGDDGSGRPSDILRGLNEVLKLKASGVDIDVVNMSLGGEPDGIPDTIDPINKMVERVSRAGITVIAAAGNSGPNPHTIGSPADSKSAIAIGASLDEKTVSDFSSRGPTDDGLQRPDVLAPGEFIVSWGVPYSEMYQTAEVVDTLRNMPADDLKTLLTEKPQLREGLGIPEEALQLPADQLEQILKPALPPVYLTAEGNVAAPGTSFASPLTAGVAAVIEQAKDLTPQEMKDLLRGTADNMGAQYTQMDQGAGFVNAEKALKAVTG